MEMDEFAREVLKRLYAFEIGRLAVGYIDSLEPDKLHTMVESEAVNLIAEIKSLLDDEFMVDEDCFHRIDAIVGAFERRGFQTNRHNR